MADVALGIDRGTSGLRIAAVKSSGEVVAMASATIDLPTLSGKHHQQDPIAWWEAVQKTFAKLDLKGHSAVALAIDGTSGTILSVDRSGNPIGLALMYNDIAKASDVAKIVAVAPQETNGSDYAIFFRMKKQADRLCSLFVMSAYPLNKPRAKVDLSGRMKFKTAVAKIATGRMPKFPLQRH